TISKAVHAGVTNVRLIEIDASEALDRLFAPGSVAEVWTFFPDPWPKSKHHKRRLVQPGFAEVVADVLVPGGTWRLATD
ncbi:tRNA (guanine-N7)-methyltransferase, partial [Xanthomonas citri pv. citri]|nr:tRNA (guanine-N7)-methyltransferase [Xanthomonas citri pv. citri]